ncbi:Ribokinase-like protein [Microstroma glucosiphilum]|uniref:pyridoxal kinase n=1 Tax=Pseudomicrostroma glucosiphilum TaxID=1684307 RepID=A0A316U367_9BASI|nr:Ribokinase-like protein [Pseudomicrostroma glucosiphilum]PWN19278.1 Ribokinase-like protein [Pseudomicrostroma glucosiphilum]
MAANVPEPSRLLSVQSHVVSGYVGNRSATFPLQLLGWDVDVINTVQFSNHTGYGRWKGLRFDDSHISSLFQGLEENGLLKQSRMLSGYMPSPSVVQAVLEAVERIREVNPELIYLCDPVMGDMGRGMYVDKEVLPVYRSMLRYTTIITPNQFEAQILADEEITSIPSLLSVLQSLHTQGANHVLITSVSLSDTDILKIGATPSSEPSMVLVGSSRPSTDTPLKPWFIQFPEVRGYFSGVGDLFAAMTLGRFQNLTAQDVEAETSVTPIARAAELAVAVVQAVLAKTQKSMDALEQEVTEGSSGDDAQARVDRMRGRELKIIQSKREIENPEVAYQAKFFKETSG